MLDDPAQHGAVPAPSKSDRSLYLNVDDQSLRQDAERCLANYGTKFEPAIITGTNGLYFYANGRAVLDWTSGQVCCSYILISISAKTTRCLV